jgi:hypothetical protein
VKNAPITTKQAMAVTGLTARSSFWRAIDIERQEGRITPLKYGTRTFRFDPQEIAAFKARRLATVDAEIQAADGRRTRNGF